MKCIVCTSNEVTEREVCNECYDGKSFLCPESNCTSSKPTLRKLRLHHNAAHNKTLPNSRCKSCKVPFNGQTRYCGSCSKPSKSRETTCVDCEEPFEYYPSSTSGKYCSDCPTTSESEIQVNDKDYKKNSRDDRRFDSPERRRSNPKVKGEIAEQILKSEFMKIGYSVLEPTGDSNSFDFVLYTGTDFIRIQCKTGRYREGCIHFSTKSNGWSQEDRDYNGEIEYFAVWCDDLEQSYLVPIEMCGSSSKSLRVDEPEVSNSNIDWASDYEI